MTGISLTLAILLGVLWHRTREPGLALISGAYFLTSIYEVLVVGLGSAAPTQHGTLFTLTGMFASLSLIVGVMAFLRGPEQRVKRDLLEGIGIACAIFGMLWLWLDPSLAGYLALSALALRCAFLAGQAYKREPQAGYHWLVLALLGQPLLATFALTSPGRLAETSILSSFPWFFIAMAVLGVSLHRSRLQTRREQDGRIHAERKIQEHIYLDNLTGLLNRYASWEQIRELIRLGQPFGLLAIDLDNFRRINNHFGHTVGDQLILDVANSLQGCLPANHILTRHGNDDFLVIATGEISHPRLVLSAQQITHHLNRPVTLGESSVFIDVSVGIACYPEHGDSLDGLLRNVNTALYEAKKLGGGLVQVFDSGMQQALQESMWMDSSLREALAQGHFTLHYQPKVRMTNGSLAGFEALLRWNHLERGQMSPSTFVRSAENTGAIIPLGRWVIAQVAKQASEWARVGFNHRIALNISVIQLKDPELIPLLEAAQQTANGLLDIEITESSLMEEEAKVLTFIEECRRRGFGIHLDDFGTGYSSLSQMGRLPLDVVKLDRSFINGSLATRNRTLVRSLVAAASELGFKVVAEGVETEEQAAFLTGIGVSYAQGWLYSTALPAVEILRLYAATANSPRVQAAKIFTLR